MPRSRPAARRHPETARPDRCPTTELRLFGERQRHAAAAAAGVEDPPAQRDAGPLEERDDLGAAVILEQRVVVFGPEPEVRVRLDGAFVNRRARPRSSRAVARGCRPPNLSMSAARSCPVAVSATSNVMTTRAIGIRVEHVVDDRALRSRRRARRRSEYIAHHRAASGPRSCRSSRPTNTGLMSVLERQTVGELAVDQRAGRQPRADFDRRREVLVAAAARPLRELHQVAAQTIAANTMAARGDHRCRASQRADARPEGVDQRSRRQQRNGGREPDVRADLVAGSADDAADRAAQHVAAEGHDRQRRAAARVARNPAPDRRARSADGRPGQIAASAATAGMKNTKRRSLPTSCTINSSGPEADPQSSSRSAARTSRHRASAVRAPVIADHDQRPIAREDVVQDREPGDAIDQRLEVVARLPRYRHLPVVEAVVVSSAARRRSHERDADRRRQGQRGPRSMRRRAVAAWSVPSRPMNHDDDGIARNGRDEEGRCRLGEERQQGADPPPATPQTRPVLCADVAVPGRDHQGDHRRLHNRRAVVHHVDVVGRDERRRQSGQRAARRYVESPSASSRTEAAPASCDTRRACQTPTPNAANDRYSRTVKTGAMNIGFQASVAHVPHSARFRALCTHAPSSCQTTPTVGFHGGSAVGKTTRTRCRQTMTPTKAIPNRRLVTSAARPRSRPGPAIGS